MASYKVYIDKLDKKLHEKNKYTDYLEKIEKTTNVPRLYFVGGLIAIWAIYMIFGHGAELICNSIGFVYPAYSSMIAIESHNKDDDTKWLTYWVVFAALMVTEFFSEFILGWVPFYWLIKCLFLIYCFAPITNNGSQLMYHRFLRPVFLKNRQVIDDTINKAADMAMEGAAKLATGKSE